MRPARRERGERTVSFTLAHLSDLHVTEVRVETPRLLLNKRALGWLKWRRKRRKQHRRHVVESLIDDLARIGPDHVAVTGDLTHLGLPCELAEAVMWLARLGGSSRVTAVPGNHDTYAQPIESQRWHAWAPYLGVAAEDDLLDFPHVRRVGPLALLGLSTARPSLPFRATGRLGARQLRRLAACLEKLAGDDLARVLLMHHPPVPAGQPSRRQLIDAAALRSVLAEHGAELVLHGHMHRSHFGRVAGPLGPIPVVGVPSGSDVGTRPQRRARYHLYRIEPGALRPARITCEVRGYDPSTGRFEREETRPF